MQDQYGYSGGCATCHREYVKKLKAENAKLKEELALQKTMTGGHAAMANSYLDKIAELLMEKYDEVGAH